MHMRISWGVFVKTLTPRPHPGRLGVRGSGIRTLGVALMVSVCGKDGEPLGGTEGNRTQ